MAGRPIQDLLVIYPSLFFELPKINDALAIYKKLVNQVLPLTELNNEWIWGATGAGKSRKFHDEHREYFKKPKDLFWDGYTSEKVVYLEDVDASWGDVLYDLKCWADYYIFEGRIKHKPPIRIRPEKVVVTSNYTIRECIERMYKMYKKDHDEEFILAIERRFKQIRIIKPANPDPLNVFPNNYFIDQVDIFDGVDIFEGL